MSAGDSQIERAFSGAGIAHSADTTAKREELAGGEHGSRDTTPALGAAGEPASYRRAAEGARVALHERKFRDALWSYLYGRDTRYSRDEALADGASASATRRARSGDRAASVQGPMMKPAIWTWEIPLYFWTGGIAAGSSFVALACDISGDHRSARLARGVALAGALPSPVLLVADLGRPARFLNMLRIFKPRSPMSTGAWCLAAFGTLAGTAVATDLAGRPRAGRALGAANAVLGGYLGSYTGVLLSSTAIPVWARSRRLLGPIFVATAVATGAAATRLTLVAWGLPDGHPTRRALGWIEMGAMGSELLLSSLNRRRLGRFGEPLEEGRAGTLFGLAKQLVLAGLALRLARDRAGPRAHHVASACYLAGGLAFRYAWVAAGHQSAGDDEAVARMARGDA